MKNWPLIWLALWLLVCVIGSIFLSSPMQLEKALQPPTLAAPAGFDPFGRNVFTVTVKAGAQSTLLAAFAVTVLSLLGLWVAAVLAVLPRTIREKSIRIVDLLIVFPDLLISLTIAAIVGPSTGSLLLALIAGGAPPLIRLLYSRAAEIESEDYIRAAIALGSTRWQIARRHILPQLTTFCGIKIPNLFAHALLAEAALSYLGIGAPLGELTWGSVLRQAQDYLLDAPHIAIVAGVPLVLTVMALQRLTEGAVDIRLRSGK